MSTMIGIMGESGAGKTTSLRNLDPKTTYYIDCDKKGLSWKGWKKQYNKEAKNYLVCDDPKVVAGYVGQISDKCPNIKTIVIDTLNGLMVAEEMRRSREKGFDKWQDLASYIWGLLDVCLTLRDDLVVIITAHSQTDRDELGNVWTRIKTSGRKLDKMVPESKFTTVLLAKTNENGEHIFETQSNYSTAKSPMGMLDKEIPNDIVPVLKALDEF